MKKNGHALAEKKSGRTRRVVRENIREHKSENVLKITNEEDLPRTVLLDWEVLVVIFRVRILSGILDAYLFNTIEYLEVEWPHSKRYERDQLLATSQCTISQCALCGEQIEDGEIRGERRQ